METILAVLGWVELLAFPIALFYMGKSFWCNNTESPYILGVEVTLIVTLLFCILYHPHWAVGLMILLMTYFVQRLIKQLKRDSDKRKSFGHGPESQTGG